MVGEQKGGLHSIIIFFNMQANDGYFTVEGECYPRRKLQYDFFWFVMIKKIFKLCKISLNNRAYCQMPGLV